MKEKGRVQARAFGGTRNKYGARKTVVGGIKFDSAREAKRWEALCFLEQDGQITSLKRQVKYELAPSVKLAGEKRARPAIRTVIDFTYWERGAFVAEDSKGFETPVSRLKRHLMKSVHGIDVRLS